MSATSAASPLQGGESQPATSRGLFQASSRISPREIAVFTRQFATMMKAGVPLLASFDIVMRGSGNAAFRRMLAAIRAEVEAGSLLSEALRQQPRHFDALYCNLVEAGEISGTLDAMMERLAQYMEKSLALRAKIKAALLYPAAVVLTALVVVAVIMIFVIPVFQQVFASLGAELPAPTQLVIATSEFFVAHGATLLLAPAAAALLLRHVWRRQRKVQILVDRLLLKLPLAGRLLQQACVARWARTLSTMFAAGVPLVQALPAVGRAAGNAVYLQATARVRHALADGASLTTAMARARVFPAMLLQMCAIGEGSGTMDDMLAKAADFHEAEADALVAGLSSLMEPFIIAFLGLVVGGIVIAMYLPIFQLGQVV